MWLLSIVIGLSAANPRLLSEGYTRRLTSLAATEYSKKISTEEEHSVVYFPSPDELSTLLITRMTEKLEAGEKIFDFDTSTITCEWGEGPDYFRFAPQFKAAPMPFLGPVTFANHCYEEVTVEVSSISQTSVSLSITSWKPSGLCYDTYMVAILNRAHIFVVDFFGSKTITFENITSSELFDVQENGIRVFTFCDGIEELMTDLLMTVQLFFGGLGLDPIIPIFGSHTTKEQEAANVKFISKAMGYDIEKRTVSKIAIQESDIHSGDFLAVIRLDGLDEIIMFGTGGRVGHSTMALWVEENGVRELYIVESQGAWYWPRAGLEMNKFSDWIKWAENASFNVAVLPLKQQYRDIFNETAVYEWFLTVAGMPYGYHNFVFGWIDTIADNLPPILDPQILTIGFSLVEAILPAAIDSVYGQAMNKRLGTTGLKIADLQVVAMQQGLTMLEVMTQVEMDGWWYSDGYSYVCSSFVLAMYKKAGILGDLPMQGTEFTPKDVYSLTIFDKNATLPAVCTAADPMLPYCQILGYYRINLGSDYSSIDPYANMNEHCPSVAPDYIRTPGC